MHKLGINVGFCSLFCSTFKSTKTRTPAVSETGQVVDALAIAALRK